MHDSFGTERRQARSTFLEELKEAIAQDRRALRDLEHTPNKMVAERDELMAPFEAGTGWCNRCSKEWTQAEVIPLESRREKVYYKCPDCGLLLHLD